MKPKNIDELVENEDYKTPYQRLTDGVPGINEFILGSGMLVFGVYTKNAGLYIPSIGMFAAAGCRLYARIKYGKRKDK